MLVRNATLLIWIPVFLSAIYISTACAHWNGSDYSISLENESGDPLSVYHHRGKTFVLGHFGDRYNIRVHNYSDRRIEAVLSVDGRDAVSGEVADYVHQRGYVIPPHEEVLIKGFRQSLSRVAAFRFTDSERSYSSRRGTPQHVGVIGVAVFREREPQTPPRPLSLSKHDYQFYKKREKGEYKENSKQYSGGRSQDAPSAQAESSHASRNRTHHYSSPRRSMLERNNLGTEYAESRYDRAREVRFIRATPKHPSRIIRLYYDDRHGLLARGIPVYPRAHHHPITEYQPEAFPRNRFAPPPP